MPTATKRRKKKRTEPETIGSSVDQVLNGASANGNGHTNGHAEPHIRFSDDACESILEARRNLREKQSLEEDAKRDLREARAAREKATEALTTAIDEANQPTLFNRDGKPKTAPSEAIPPQVEGKPLSSFGSADDGSWRGDSIRCLVEHGLPDHLATKLVDGAVTNLGRVLQVDAMAVPLFEQLQRVQYSDALFAKSKEWLAGFEKRMLTVPLDPHWDWAYHYFIASWMGRNGVAGTERVNYQLAVRWTAGGGSGPVRFRSAVESIPAWCDRLRNVVILTDDLFKIMPRIQDDDGTSIYVDPPYLHGTMSGKGRYLYDFEAHQHNRLAEEAKRFKKARVVLSYYEDSALRDLYRGWTFIDCSRHKHLHVQNRRGSKRAEAPEVLIVNGEAVAE